MHFNAYQLPEPGALALYDKVSMMAHSCCPSADYDFQDDFEMYVYALTDLPSGDEVTVSYIGPQSLCQSTDRRQLVLRSWLFLCQCSRCCWSCDLSRGFCCPDPWCAGICFLSNPEETDEACTDGCTVCGEVIAGPALDWALDRESAYIRALACAPPTCSEDFVKLTEDLCAASAIFRQHWLLAALDRVALRVEDESTYQARLASAQAFVAAAFAPWPWLAHYDASLAQPSCERAKRALRLAM
eukprot:5971545-Amphidinium_carterae.1